jgi:hypothetical protein
MNKKIFYIFSRLVIFSLLVWSGAAFAQDIYLKTAPQSDRPTYTGPGTDQETSEQKNPPIYIMPQVGRSNIKSQPQASKTYHLQKSGNTASRATAPSTDIRRADLQRAQELNTQEAIRIATENQKASDATVQKMNADLDRSVKAYEKAQQEEWAKNGNPGSAENIMISSGLAEPGEPNILQSQTSLEEPEPAKKKKLIYKKDKENDEPRRIFNVFE